MATEQRLIDAHTLELDMRAFADKIAYHGRMEIAQGVVNAIGIVHAAPTVDAVEVVHGYWRRARKPVTANMECSVCHKEYLLSDHNYCPNCGAKMDLEV